MVDISWLAQMRRFRQRCNACRNVLDEAMLAAPAEDGGSLGSHMIGTVRAVVVRAQTRVAPSCCETRDFIVGLLAILP